MYHIIILIKLSYPSRTVASLGNLRKPLSALLNAPRRVQHICIKVFIWLDHEAIKGLKEIRHVTNTLFALQLLFCCHRDLIVLNTIIAEQYKDTF
jgi:hypothetical protein